MNHKDKRSDLERQLEEKAWNRLEYSGWVNRNCNSFDVNIRYYLHAKDYFVTAPNSIPYVEAERKVKSNFYVVRFQPIDKKIVGGIFVCFIEADSLSVIDVVGEP